MLQGLKNLIPWTGDKPEPDNSGQLGSNRSGMSQLQAALQNAQNTSSSPYVWQSASGTSPYPGSQNVAVGYQGVYMTGTSTGYASWQDPEVAELKKTMAQLIRRIEWLEAQPILKDNPPPIGLIEKEES